MVTTFFSPHHAAPIEGMSLRNCYDHATLTFYWIPKEGDSDMTNDGRTVTLDGPKTKDLMGTDGKSIAKVAEITYDKFQMEGTGLLENGILVNLGGSKDKFQKVDRTSDPFGIGSNENPLTPWVSVASNDLKRGTLLYVKELDGVQLPYGQVHNGCVRVDDEGWSFGKCQIDFFTLQFSAYKDLDNKIPEKVTCMYKSLIFVIVNYLSITFYK
ncbi:hypothetical protein BCR42DRAFT_368947 [Absidia repens]|uniref:3D domain-containing protein n=1 Tax=Absidia repens TaxID=90262 RepID=A0A1X2IRQ0_9FUNG|nr:hypothetical protein BCR42DRAFT_368947 [Absidia repens]